MYARKVAVAVASGVCDRGIVICGSGVGACIAASKVPGCRAAMCHDTFSARQGVEDDDMNVICLGARVIGSQLAAECVRAFLGARFSGADRHLRRLAEIRAIEEDARRGVFDAGEGEAIMSQNPLQKLAELGQSVWYDFIRRDLYQGPELKRLIEEDGLKGMTSNPTIFQKAIAGSSLYDEDIREGSAGKDPAAIFESLAVADVRAAADIFRPVYDASGGDDGFVSIEVGPHLARDTQGTIVEARRLWSSCGRPNVMVKIPGTAEGVPAIRQCLSEGININITLLFSVPRYREVMEAYLSALEDRVARQQKVDRVRSVASFFVSRVDTNVDKKLDALAQAGKPKAAALRARLGIANARVAYQAFQEVFGGSRFAALKGEAARLQRPLWASTSTKDPSLPDLYYVEALIAPTSVDTMPPETFQAYKDHGNPKVRIAEDLPAAQSAFAMLSELSIDFADVARELETEGVQKFSDSFDGLLQTIAEKERSMRVA